MMADTGNWGYLKRSMASLLGLLMMSSPALGESKFPSLHKEKKCQMLAF